MCPSGIGGEKQETKIYQLLQFLAALVYLGFQKKMKNGKKVAKEDFV